MNFHYVILRGGSALSAGWYVAVGETNVIKKKKDKTLAYMHS